MPAVGLIQGVGVALPDGEAPCEHAASDASANTTTTTTAAATASPRTLRGGVNTFTVYP